MNTAELADILEALATILRSTPAKDVSQLAKRASRTSPRPNIAIRKKEILENEKVSKQDLAEFINRHEIPITINSKDSRQALKNRLMRFYNQSNVPLDSSGTRSKEKRPATSPELMQALSFLLGMGNAKNKQR